MALEHGFSPNITVEVGLCLQSAEVSAQAIAFLISVFWLALAILLFFSRYQQFQGSTLLTIASIAVLYWVTISCLEYWMPTSKCKSLIAAFAWPGIFATALAFLGFVARFTLGVSRISRGGVEYVISTAAVAVFGLILTNNQHSLFLMTGVTSSGEYSAAAPVDAGPVLFFIASISQLLATCATGLLLGGMLMGSEFSRRQLLVFAPLSVPPTASGIVTLFVGKDAIGFDPTPWITLATAIAFWIDLRLSHMWEIKIAAADRMFDNHSAAIMVVSPKGTLRQWNKRAGDLIGIGQHNAPKGSTWLFGALRELRYKPLVRQSFTMSNSGLTFKLEASPLKAKVLAKDVHLGWIVFVDANDWAISENQKLQAQLANQASELGAAVRARMEAEVAALRDPLTGLLNLRALDLICTRIARSGEVGQQYVMALIDLNNFKDINDTYGHGIGDRVLQVFANTLRVSFRRTDLVFRIGGDEFLVLAKGMETAEMTDAMNTVNARVQSNLDNADLPDDVSVGFSTGFSFWNPDSLTFAEAKHSADVKLYHSKRTIAGGLLRARRSRMTSSQ